ncbi:DUF4124 domain-containing protein [Shewanella sp. C32]|uniref:DUF4124 domain-containing protein n=1 Tax=Shewanella electrica TaxID=515560 RepID=A0ABT2FQZ6_9GAMM|nr:DUF4124 domain-containing protein [Shewanella electrica]MCH1927064.1 DUF4124 domain-containing protein [Shewanella electrica]MCS4558668.1 DUF4124 domain-containing protein [Shewanella electrica]
MLKHSLLLVMLMTISLPIVQAATIYKWVDKNGVTHFSQDPPPTENQTTEQLDSAKLAPPKLGSVAPSTTAEPAPAATNPSVAEISARNAEQAKSICEQAKFQLDVLNTHRRLQRQDEATGQVIEMSEEERQQQIATQQQRIKLFCGKA